jgi:glycerol-3-phosphate dehydrogenase (NAD(P)+)
VKVCVVGGGSWGSVFAALLAANGHEVTLACRDAGQAAAIAATGRNPRYVREVDLAGVEARSLSDGPAEGAGLVVLAVPSRAFAEVVAALPVERSPVLILTKGLDPATGSRLSELVAARPAAVLSGPNHAEEIGQGLPAATVVACADLDLAVLLQHEIISPRFRVYASDDLVGVELCGAAKNVIALAAGGVDGLGLGDNAKASLLSRGLREMARLGEAFGARADTFSGLAGMGDLIVTCWSRHSRNRRAGELLVLGRSPDEAAEEIGTVAEGLTTAPVLQRLAARAGIELPITEAVCAVLGGAPPAGLVSTLMEREPRTE